MKKRIIAVMLIMVMTMGLVACADSGKKETPSATPTQAAAPTDTVDEQSPAEENLQVTYPVTLTDQAGRKVTIEKEPTKVVSGYYISTSLLIALGQKDKLVGIEAKADKRAIYKLSAPELTKLPSVGTAKEFDLEGCAALEPELVILPKKLKDAADTLSELGITVLLVNPEDQDLMNEARQLVATALNCLDRAKKLEEFTKAQEQFLADKVGSLDKPSVYFTSNSSILATAGALMYQSTEITLAGGKNVAEAINDTYWAEIDYEQLLAWNPEYIILASDSVNTVDDVMNDANLAECTAVKNAHVYQMPADAESWDSPIPGGILGAVWMASVLHPDAVSEEEALQIIEDFYGEFYGFSYKAK